ncbi:follicle-stimulating hormone receptor-like [Aethina tumida]|uniref:follicle-stimulating hormone receptor-like n=1 Tax=Aethina tumida TaxID=116153 RepID=UPI002147F40B|nr:follicle-stimulating hormone receptor-like [Aethina tumida]
MSLLLISLTIFSTIVKPSTTDGNFITSTTERSPHKKIIIKPLYKESVPLEPPDLVEGESLLPSNNDFATNVKEQEYIPREEKGDTAPIIAQAEKVVIRKLEDEPAELNAFHCVTEIMNELEVRCYGSGLKEVPQNLTETLQKLTIIEASIEMIRKDSFTKYGNITDVTLGNLQHLSVIEKGSFANIPHLTSIYITEAPKLKYLNGLLHGVTSKKFKSLRILQTGLVEISQLFYELDIIELVDLDSNKIRKIQSNSIKINANQLSMNFNEITSIEDYAFNGSQIGKLHFNGNRKLKSLNSDAFTGMKTLFELDLSSTSIENLPISGLKELEVLKIQRTPSLKTIPSIYDLPNLKRALLTYSFHCCAFKYPEQHHPEKHAEYRKLCPIDTGQDADLHSRRRRHSRKTRDDDSEESNESVEDTFNYGVPSPNIEHGHYEGSLNRSEWDPVTGRTIGVQKAKYYEGADEEEGIFHDLTAVGQSNTIQACGKLSKKTPTECQPEPNALNPCEDIMGSSWLRISVWFVVVLAVVGNLAVIIVVLFSGTEINVSRFLICNLAFADFCMGLYLLLIASMDMHSVGTYFNFAFDWQYGLGCQLAGFLTVFASHLSIFTLTVVTLERWFAITYAIHLTRRIRIGAAAKTMLGGWFYSFLIAALPILGVSNYSSTSICLPMEVNTVIDQAYLYAIIIVNGLAFVLIVFCYAQIYFSLGYETRRANTKGEMTIAKKMALLIFTDFATWAPIAFFGLTALTGYPLIGVTRSKILLVFFYPLNACANPYLYALMTAQYRKDLLQMISRIGLWKSQARNYTVTTTLRTSNNSQPVPLLTKTNGNCHHVKTELDDTYV